MSTFDLEAAKRGEPVEMSVSPDWVPVHFVGLSVEGLLVVQERVVRGKINYCSAAQLRMAPKKVKVRYRVAAYRCMDGKSRARLAQDEDTADMFASDGSHDGWLTDWQEAEVEQQFQNKDKS